MNREILDNQQKNKLYWKLKPNLDGQLTGLLFTDLENRLWCPLWWQLDDQFWIQLDIQFNGQLGYELLDQLEKEFEK